MSESLNDNSPKGPGVFMRGTAIYRVKKARESGRLYACKLEGESFVYAGGTIFGLRESDRITHDQAIAYGLRTGVCLMCSLNLSDPVSVEGGIGPVCEKRWFGDERKARLARMKAEGKVTKARPAALAETRQIGEGLTLTINSDEVIYLDPCKNCGHPHIEGEFHFVGSPIDSDMCPCRTLAETMLI